MRHSLSYLRPNLDDILCSKASCAGIIAIIQITRYLDIKHYTYASDIDKSTPFVILEKVNYFSKYIYESPRARTVRILQGGV